MISHVITDSPPSQAITAYFGKDQMWLVWGLMQGLKGFLSFLSAPILGALSDAFGRKHFLLLTVFSTCIPLPLLFFNNLWPHVLAGQYNICLSTNHC